jgi:hypothetical protein
MLEMRGGASWLWRAGRRSVCGRRDSGREPGRVGRLVDCGDVATLGRVRADGGEGVRTVKAGSPSRA